MCFYITATMPEGTQMENIREILELYKMEFSEIYNHFVQAQLRPGELYFRATKDYCDCAFSFSYTFHFKNLKNHKKF